MTGDDTISVEGLGEPDPELAAELPPEPEAPDETGGIPDVSPGDQRLLMVESLTAAIQAPFAIVATRRGEHWRVSPDEARSVAEPLALVIPATALTERLVAASPWLAAGSQLYALVQVRLAADAATEQEGTDAPRPPRPHAVPDPAPAPRGAAGPPRARVRREPPPDGANDGREPFTGAGLGLGSPGVGARPAGDGE